MDRIKEKLLLSDKWGKLHGYTVELDTKDGKKELAYREVYENGDGAAVLLFNAKKNTVILIRQFRITSYLKGNDDGLLVEVAAGLLEGELPEIRIKAEILEETGYQVNEVIPVLQSFASPGAFMEEIYLFLAPYTEEMKISDGGGLESENENIEVLEFEFDEVVSMLKNGKIRDSKTIILIQFMMLNSKNYGMKYH